jgi:hypothetical protein
MGEVTEATLSLAAKILLRYTKAPADRECLINATIDGQAQTLSCVNSFAEDQIAPLRIGTP